MGAYCLNSLLESRVKMADPLGGEEDLLPSIRQLIGSIKPTVRAASSLPAAEDMVLHLEETDENFHR